MHLAPLLFIFSCLSWGELRSGLPISPDLQAAVVPAPSIDKDNAREQWIEGSAELLKAEWIRLLPEVDKDVADFLEKSGAEIEIVPPSEGIFTNPGHIAQYEKGRILVNAVALEYFGKLLFESVPADGAYEKLALISLPMISHEARHGISRMELEKKFGLDYPYGSLEDEIVAFAHQALLSKKIERMHRSQLRGCEGHPLYQENHNLVVMMNFGGITGTVKAAHSYEGVPGITDKKYGIAEYIAGAKAYQKHPSMAVADRESFLKNNVEPKLEQYASEIDRQKAEAARDFLEEPSRLEGLVQYYLDEMAEYHRSWEEGR